MSKATVTTQLFSPHYDILEPLGEGSIATVYKVRAARDGSHRALKALKPEQARTARAIRRFEDEFRILRRLHHPSLPEVFDYGIAADKTRYIVMELVDGDPLDAYFPKHPDDLWLLIYELTEAVAFVHAHGLLHLDLKPSNTLVKTVHTRSGAGRPLVILIDFGMSYKRQAGGEVLLVGTPDYMAPEIIRGAEAPTRAADYYSLGVILYELVEGRTPFSGTMHDILQAHLAREITFSRERMEYAELYPWITRLLSKDANARLETFQDFRRIVADRLGDAPAELDRAYALGYIESLGHIGKADVWARLEAWVGDVSAALLSPPSSAAAKRPSSHRAETDAPDGGHDLDRRIQEDLLAPASERAAAVEAAQRVRSLRRYLVLSGPPGSGKSYLVDALAAELAPHGAAVVRLGAGGDFGRLAGGAGLAERGGRGIDPAALIVDRFRAAWRGLEGLARGAGVVIAVDDVSDLDDVQRQFLEYLVNRIELSVSEGGEPRMVLALSDRSPALRSDLVRLGAREDAIEVVDIPPPTRRDVEQVASAFHGRMSGVGERRALAGYLESHLESSGALTFALRRGVTSSALRYARGRWQFRKKKIARRKTLRSSSTEYYEHVLTDLPDAARALVRWLCVHPGGMPVDGLSVLAGLDAAGLRHAVESVRPYRVVETSEEHAQVRFVSDAIRRAFYALVDADVRRRMHEAYIDYLDRTKQATREWFETRAFHCERAGRTQEALRMRVRAIREARAQQDVSSLRRLAIGGIAFARRLDVGEWRGRRHIERYFIRTLVDAEWMVSNYGAVVERVETYFEREGREIPLSLVYKYATALERAGNSEKCEAVVAESKRRMPEGKPRETYYNVLLVEASVEYTRCRYNESLKTLQQIDQGALDRFTLARVYVVFMLNHYALGNAAETARFQRMAESASIESDNYESLLRARFVEVVSLVNESQYEKAKPVIRDSLRLAHRNRVYRSLALMYFEASAVYYEEGNYEKAARYLDKTIRTSIDSGIKDQLNEYVLRYSMIYQRMGLHGNALRYAIVTLERTTLDRSVDKRFYAIAQVLSTLVSIHSHKAAEYKATLVEAIEGVQSEFRRGFYHNVLGDYYVMERDYERALAEYDAAIGRYVEMHYDDDVARVGMRKVWAYLALKALDKAGEMLDPLEARVKALESQDIKGELQMLKLAYLRERGRTGADLLEQIAACKRVRSTLGDFDLLLSLDLLLFRTCLFLDDVEGAQKHFGDYYTRVKQLCSNLPSSDYVEDYVQSPDFRQAAREFKAIHTKKTGR